MEELIDSPELREPNVQRAIGPTLQGTNKSTLPAIRRRHSVSNRHRTKVASVAKGRPTRRKAKQEVAR
jgi:hypothetical protein